MLLDVLLATLVQTTVRSRAGPCVAHTACPEGVVDVSESGVADLLADERVHARSTGVAS